MVNKHSSELDSPKTHLEWLLTKDAAWKISNQLNSIIEPCLEQDPFSQTLLITKSTTIKDLKSDIDMFPLDYYNHNLDTSPEYYDQIITTRTYQDRLDTLDNVRSAGMKVCSGGIVGLGEEGKDRSGLLVQLANMPVQPESVPINKLVKVKGTPLDSVEDLDEFEFIKTIAIAIFSNYLFSFILAGYILLLAMVAAIILTIQKTFVSKSQNIYTQIMADYQKSIVNYY